MNNEVWAVTGSDALEASMPRSPLLDVKVMMVDDEPLMTELIQTHLEDAGYSNFVVVNDPLDAMAQLRRTGPGVLLLDLMMPKLSGFDLLQTIRQDPALRYMPVIVLTASAGADSKLRALQLGATDFLAKPVDASELVLRLRNTLAFHHYHKRMIEFEPVTGLPNQRFFERGISEMLDRHAQAGGLAALFSISIPECRQLRETVDQATADGLAKALARRLKRFAGLESIEPANATDVEWPPRVARLGSDQFGLLMEGLAGAEAVEAIAKRLVAVLSESVALGPHEVSPSVWIGVALSPTDGDSAEVLRKSADLAATRAQQEGAAQYKFASPELNARSYERFTLGLQLRGAAQRGELRLHYQPKLDMASNRVVGAEALVRWQHPQHGLLPPMKFIPLAEELGLMQIVGGWVIERACHDAAEWGRAGLGELMIAVNVARDQFAAGNLCQVLRQAMSDSGLPARQLVIELTESMLMDDVEGGIAAMQDLKALGVTLSIDDFGTGYSSLSYLKRFPIDELKVDRSFVFDLPGCWNDTAIVRAVIDLGHSLGISVIAEGVETAEQLSCLKRLRCDQYQGFLFSKPLPVDRFTELLSREPCLAG
jgi:EAL domain-containing protein (putative c-di-GMP-specific phosphodiesterase class I)/PleD family two-component response regulator